jgi:hypothetical protein
MKKKKIKEDVNPVSKTDKTYDATTIGKGSTSFSI